VAIDADAGGQEILLRRIGENEVTAIETCRDLVLAEKQPVATEKPDSAIGGLLAELESNQNPVLFQTYDFRVLTGVGETAPGEAKSHTGDGGTTGGFAFIAYPAMYRSSGVMSFIVDQDGVVYQKDLVLATAKRAAVMTAYQLVPDLGPAPTEP
jgi:Protein of unknown function (DUF2950)